MYDFMILGGDERQVYLRNIMSGQGYTVKSCLLTDNNICSGKHTQKQHFTDSCSGQKKPRMVKDIIDTLEEKDKILNEIGQAKALLAPIPLAAGNGILNSKAGKAEITLDEMYDNMVKGQYLFAGCIPKWFELKCTKKGCICFDYMEDEAIAVSNAVATAEGIIAEAVMKYKGNLHGTHCLVLGFGRCGRVLADKLKGLSAKVSICIRKTSDEAWAESLGYRAVNLKKLKDSIGKFPVIFNTIPKQVIDREVLANVRKDVQIFDIASAPGGVDYDAAGRMGINAGLYPSLPGKYSPDASAKILSEAVKRVI